MRIFIRYSWFITFAVLCFGVAYYAFMLLQQPFNPYNEFQQKIAASGWVMPVHFYAGGLALALIPFQLSQKLRRKSMRIHRTIGMLYLVCVVAGGISGLLMSLNADGGLIAQTGFFCLSVLWLFSTLVAVYFAINGNILEHQKWIYRSVALTAAGITLRLFLGIGLGILQLPFLTVYVPTAWLCWTINLLICELIIYHKKSTTSAAFKHAIKI